MYIAANVMDTPNGRALLQACRSFFGEFSDYVIVSGATDKGFKIDSGESGVFIKRTNIDFGRAEYVSGCYVRYASIGREFGSDSSYMNSTKEIHSKLEISFNARKEDLKINFDGDNASDVLKKYFDLDIIRNVFAPKIAANDERRINEERSRRVEESKKKMDKQILQFMVANFQTIFTQAMEAASQNDGFKTLSPQDQKQVIASSAYNAFFKLFEDYQAKNNPNFQSKFYESGNGMYRLLKVPGSL